MSARINISSSSSGIIAVGHGTIQKFLYGWWDDDETNGTKRNQVSQIRTILSNEKHKYYVLCFVRCCILSPLPSSLVCMLRRCHFVLWCCFVTPKCAHVNRQRCMKYCQTINSTAHIKCQETESCFFDNGNRAYKTYTSICLGNQVTFACTHTVIPFPC